MDAGRSRPPDPGGEASNRGQESSHENGSLLKGIILNQNQTPGASSTHGLPLSGIISNPNQTPLGASPNGPPLSGIIQNQNQTPPAAGEPSGSSRQPKTGKQQSASVAGSRQPGSMARFSTGCSKTALPRAPRGTKDELLAKLRQMRDEKDAAARAASTGGDKRVAPESEHSDEARVIKRPQKAPPANDFPFKVIVPLSSSRSLAWVDFGHDSAKHLIGSLSRLPGIGVKVAVRAGRMGDPLIVLTMSVSRAKCVMHMSEWNIGVKCIFDGYLAM